MYVLVRVGTEVVVAVGRLEGERVAGVLHARGETFPHPVTLVLRPEEYLAFREGVLWKAGQFLCNLTEDQFRIQDVVLVTGIGDFDFRDWCRDKSIK